MFLQIPFITSPLMTVEVLNVKRNILERDVEY